MRKILISKNLFDFDPCSFPQNLGLLLLAGKNLEGKGVRFASLLKQRVLRLPAVPIISGPGYGRQGQMSQPVSFF
jgi:hypothetical protein